MVRIKARLAGKVDSLGKSRNAEPSRLVGSLNEVLFEPIAKLWVDEWQSRFKVIFGIE